VNPEVSVEDYFIVWVTSGGSTKWVSLSGSSVKAGTRGFKDYAWIQVPIEKIPDWSPVFEEGSIITKGLNADSYGSSNPVRVSVWTMTQTSADGSYDAGRYVSRFGARFQRKNCLASDRKPHVRIIDWQEQRQEGVVFENSAASLYLDNCDSNLVKGNSGSLVTTERNIKEIRGLFHTIWGVKPKDIPRIKSVEYFGSLGQWLAPSSYEHIWSVALSIQAIPLPDFQSNQL
jgi:hypothetical protein